jgi:hypothetical protein
VKDTEWYAALWGSGPPWRFREVRLDLAADRVDVWIDEAAGAQGAEGRRRERLKGTKHLWLANEENVPEWRRAEFEAVKGEN